jgi:peptidyl-prolyl cis-trans isomerase A (cyclophilin A)
VASKAKDLVLMIGLGGVALVVVGGVVFGMTRKPKLNDDTEDAGKRRGVPETTSPTLDTSESDYDPQGRFTIDDAERAVPGTGSFVATIRTGKGELTCKLFDTQAPNTVANFVGLATGARAWKDPKKNKWVHRPAYDGTVFHRTIQGFMIQGGDPLGNGTGEPGYTIPDEMWGGRHDRPGLLCMANRGPNTNGAQFFIMDGSAPHIDSSYTIFGDCTPVEVIHEIASQPTNGDRPKAPVEIQSIAIRRGS